MPTSFTLLLTQYLISFLLDPMILSPGLPLLLLYLLFSLLLLPFRTNSWCFCSSVELQLLSSPLAIPTYSSPVNTFPRTPRALHLSTDFIIAFKISRITLILWVKPRPCLGFAWGKRNASSWNSFSLFLTCHISTIIPLTCQFFYDTFPKSPREYHIPYVGSQDIPSHILYSTHPFVS